MTTLPELSTIVGAAAAQKDMRARTDLSEPGWAFWERRNLNMHRVVGLFRGSQQATDARRLDAELRGALARNFKRAWWRGIAYGVVANVGAVSWTPDDLKLLVDAYENEKGTMQWVVLVTGDTRKVTGVHTWIEGYLSPVYRDILQTLAARGCQITSIMKGKDGLMKFLTAVADGRTRALTGHGAFPEFRDPFSANKDGAPNSTRGASS